MSVFKVFALLALLTCVAQAAPVTPAPAPFWCEDLGLVCLSSEASEFFAALSRENPDHFLPPELSEFVQRSQSARATGDLALVEALKTGFNPLAEAELKDVLLIPKKYVPVAALPDSGARLLADCKGRHLQLRADRGVLKRALSSLLQIARKPEYGQIRGRGYSLYSTRVMVTSCELGVIDSIQHICVTSHWTLTASGTERSEASFVPRAFVSPACFSLPKGATPKTPLRR